MVVVNVYTQGFDSIRDRAGTGAPDFPNGLTGTLTGNVTGTATTATLANTATVATNAPGLTGTPNITVGTVGCGNVTSTGDVTGVNATFSGNLTVQELQPRLILPLLRLIV